MKNIMIAVPFFFMLSACTGQPDPNAYFQCTPDQAAIVQKSVSVCAQDKYYSQYQCYELAVKTTCNLRFSQSKIVPPRSWLPKE